MGGNDDDQSNDNGDDKPKTKAKEGGNDDDQSNDNGDDKNGKKKDDKDGFLVIPKSATKDTDTALKKGINLSTKFDFKGIKQSLALSPSSSNGSNNGNGSNEENLIWFELDAELAFLGFTIAPDGFSLIIPPDVKGSPYFHISGFALDYKNDALEIGGGFLARPISNNSKTQSSSSSSSGSTSVIAIEVDKTLGPITFKKVGIEYKPDPAYSESKSKLTEEYDGLVTVQTTFSSKAFSLTAMGSYAYYQDQPCLFLYAMVNFPMGGPPFFFVEGLAGGFGYNRSLTIPSIDQIATFPLVSEAVDSATANKKRQKKIDPGSDKKEEGKQDTTNKEGDQDTNNKEGDQDTNNFKVLTPSNCG